MNKKQKFKKYPIINWIIFSPILIIASVLLFLPFHDFRNFYYLLLIYHFNIFLIVISSFLLLVNAFALNYELGKFNLNRLQKSLIIIFPLLLIIKRPEKINLSEDSEFQNDKNIDVDILKKEIINTHIQKNNWILSWFLYPWFFAALVTTIFAMMEITTGVLDNDYKGAMFAISLSWQFFNGVSLLISFVFIVMFFIKNLANQWTRKYPWYQRIFILIFPFLVYPLLYVKK
ncbi:hypothetical protein NV226_00440 [Mycoplasma iguanae]|uniref:Uncharacterized protein n=1 Tax=Mycoplasma iguanae TaxID=292461 RepID=A0ABY5RAH1_9MOLU|nr:hypothetical protein [Mycoplasma iguanae]UVD81774.1 hypothetical protein NV226_00440 [Mycoplasma iguanae]